VKQGQEDDLENFGFMERFFGGPWNNFVKKFRWVLIALFLGWVIAAAIIASKLRPITKQEQFLPDDHPFQVQSVISQEKFLSGGVF
jgi:preprotein translocase subunit SecG